MLDQRGQEVPDGRDNRELLKGNLAGWWSYRMAGEHRLEYAVAGAGYPAPSFLITPSCLVVR